MFVFVMLFCSCLFMAVHVHFGSCLFRSVRVYFLCSLFMSVHVYCFVHVYFVHIRNVRNVVLFMSDDVI